MVNYIDTRTGPTKVQVGTDGVRKRVTGQGGEASGRYIHQTRIRRAVSGSPAAGIGDDGGERKTRRNTSM